MSKNKFATEIDAIQRVLDDPTLTPRGVVRAVLAEISAMEFPVERESAIRAALRTFATTIASVLSAQPDMHVLAREAGELRRAVRELGRPLPLARPAEVVARSFDRLQELGWASATIDLLAQELQPGETIASVTADGITTSLRSIDRKALIVKYRPGSITPDHYPAWERQHTRSPSMASAPPRED